MDEFLPTDDVKSVKLVMLDYSQQFTKEHMSMVHKFLTMSIPVHFLSIRFSRTSLTELLKVAGSNCTNKTNLARPIHIQNKLILVSCRAEFECAILLIVQLIC